MNAATAGEGQAHNGGQQRQVVWKDFSGEDTLVLRTKEKKGAGQRESTNLDRASVVEPGLEAPCSWCRTRLP
jgi:hypothetical protein